MLPVTPLCVSSLNFAATCIAVLALVFGCTFAQQVQPQPPLIPSAATKIPDGVVSQATLSLEGELLARIRSEIGEAACVTDDHCSTLPVGERPCGGPAVWLAYSNRTGTSKKLKAWASQLADMQKQRHAVSGELSNCRHTPDPGAMCVAQRCVIRVPNSAN